MTTTGGQIGPYRLGHCLGRGGFGAVFEGTHQVTGQRVAIKFLHDTIQLTPEIQNRFVREVALLKRLDHPNIVQVYDAGLHEGSIYCAMELVECGSLKEVLTTRKKLPWRESAEVAVQVCRALDHAHQRGCVHRDLKPANLYLSEDGFVKLGDLGLARDLSNSRLTASGHTVGTWRYMAPEQIIGEDDIDGRLDIYALGCILFEMVTGRVPFDGPNFAAIFDQHLESAPSRLDIVEGDCPSSLADVVDAMLAKQPDLRPATAGEVADNLELLLSDSSAVVRLRRVDPAQQDLLEASPASSGGPNLTQRLYAGPVANTRLQHSNFWLAVAAFLAVLAGICWALLR